MCIHTPKRIRAIAERYLASLEATRAMLRSVLERRLRRGLSRLGEEDAEAAEREGSALIEAELDRLARDGLIDDGRYAEMKARSAWAGGRGARRIRVDLARKGVDREVAERELRAAAAEAAGDAEGDEAEAHALAEAEAEAARVFARRRGIGPFRREALPQEWRDRIRVERREAAAMARAGFAMDVIRRTLESSAEI